MAAAPSSAARRLFGTDGVRGVAGEFLTAELALSLARAATARVKERKKAGLKKARKRPQFSKR